MLESAGGVAWVDHVLEVGGAENLEDIVHELERMLRGQKAGSVPPQDSDALADAFELIRELSNTPGPKEVPGMPEGTEQDGFAILPGFTSWGQPFSEN